METQKLTPEDEYVVRLTFTEEQLQAGEYTLPSRQGDRPSVWVYCRVTPPTGNAYGLRFKMSWEFLELVDEAKDYIRTAITSYRARHA